MSRTTDNSFTDWDATLASGNRGVLARAITAVENDTDEAEAILRAARRLSGRALVVGMTGAPGAGKSTLVGAYVAELRRRGQTVGVLAVDPSSPLTGGALLGDRIRMLSHAGDPGVFVRSLASRGHLGGLALSTGSVVDVMDASGRDVIVVETVGVGQSEIEITDLADVRVVVWAPGAGDDVQAAKAGILEIADVLVVNKADLPQAAATEAALRSAASYGTGTPPTVMTTTATSGSGVPALADAVASVAREHGANKRRGADQRMARQVVARALQLFEQAAEGDTVLDGLVAGLRDGDLSLDEAAGRLTDHVVKS
ncbi:MAG: methylmalonyl Co-A mutase-associated GTPase MeaB [Rhodospirillaceae bacterium]|nr:methylmalonyl Co-A mutase-associated GTPase MeaB [Rhodospirillaceae bacterium]|tara:strand:+ start:1199 stop:2140 length:942 start_codon:yes stop_codon:yes gene_type:complete